MLNSFICQTAALSDYFMIKIDLGRLLLTLAMAFIVGLFVFFIYKQTFGGVMYSHNLNVSYIMLTLVTSLMLMLINNNLTLSLGMVGALSIIRFRTAVKDPIDTVFMFWAVGEGIAIGTAYFIEAIISAILIGIALIVLSVAKTKDATSYLLIVHYNENGAATVKQFINKARGAKVKSKSVTAAGNEMTIEIRVRGNEFGFVDKLSTYDGILDVTLITHQGDVVA